MAKSGSKPTYIGKVTNAGNQHVEAPIKQSEAKKGAKVTTGKDLRSGK